MKRMLTAIVVAAAGLMVAGTLGVASAEAPVPTPAPSPAPAPTPTPTPTPAPASAPVRTVSVQGVAEVPIGQDASAASATAVYRQGMAAAVADGQSKAEFLAGKSGASLGSVQAISEDGGYIQCTSSDESSEAEYEGEQPDFGSSSISVLPGRVSEGVAAPTTAPAIRKPAKHGKRRSPSAKRASVGTCTLSAQVSLAYAID